MSTKEGTASTTKSGMTEEQLSNKLVKAALDDPLISHPDFQCSRVFSLIHTLLNTPSAAHQRKKLIRQMKTVYLFHVSNGEQETKWYVDMKKSGKLGRLEKGEKAPLKPGVQIWVDDKDLVGLATGTLNPQKLFMANRIKVKGNIDNALNVEKIISQERQKLEALSAHVKSAPVKKEKGRWASIKAKL